ncbi:uncharacterized protein LOC142182142 [Nicotiana tabacum]|uniref:Uncharacterized protein LOC142182142 n=1 Tax=Nicotiana tabacum TaxID=4097 RepID=A0AC58URV1_TOBAC
MKLKAKEGAPLSDPICYRKLIRKLNFLTNTRLDISFIVHHLSQCLAVDYPTSDQYKLVIIVKLAKQGYQFFVFSPARSGVWHEVHFRVTFSNLTLRIKPVYVNDSLYRLRTDGRVIVFNTKKEKATILDLPEFMISHHDPINGKISPDFDTWLGVAQGLLTLVCVFKKSIIIATYDYVSSNWRISHTLDNFIKRHDLFDGFPYLD